MELVTIKDIVYSAIHFRVDNSTGSSPYGQKNNLFTEFADVDAAPLEVQKKVIERVYRDKPSLVKHFTEEMDNGTTFRTIFCKLDDENFQKMINWLSLGIALNNIDAF